MMFVSFLKMFVLFPKQLFYENSRSASLVFGGFEPGIRSPRYWWWFRPGRSWYWISPTSLVVAQTLGYESWRHQLRCRLRGDDTNLGGWSWGVPPTWQVFKFTRLLQGLRSLRIIRFIGGLRVLVYSMFLDFLVKDDGCKRLVQIRVLGNMCFVWMFLGTPKYHK